jgi:hypothetical protein
MTETKIVRQTIDNIFLKTARKLLPFYNSKLILSVKQCNSTTEQTIKTCVLPKLEEIINSTSSDDIFKQLEAVRSTAWLPGSTSQLCVSVDMELKKLCDTLKGKRNRLLNCNTRHFRSAFELVFCRRKAVTH